MNAVISNPNKWARFRPLPTSPAMEPNLTASLLYRPGARRDFCLLSSCRMTDRMRMMCWALTGGHKPMPRVVMRVPAQFPRLNQSQPSLHASRFWRMGPQDAVRQDRWTCSFGRQRNCASGARLHRGGKLWRLCGVGWRDLAAGHFPLRCRRCPRERHRQYVPRGRACLWVTRDNARRAA